LTCVNKLGAQMCYTEIETYCLVRPRRERTFPGGTIVMSQPKLSIENPVLSYCKAVELSYCDIDYRVFSFFFQADRK